MQKIILAAAFVFLSAPAFSQTVEQDGANDPYGLKTELAERVFLKYHKSIRAEERCNGRQFSPQDMQSMEDVIAGRMVANSPDVAVGAARLLVLNDVAKDQMDKIVSDSGCDGDPAKKMLAFFDERLASAAPAQQAPSPPDTAPESVPQPLAAPQGQ